MKDFQFLDSNLLNTEVSVDLIELNCTIFLLKGIYNLLYINFHI